MDSVEVLAKASKTTVEAGRNTSVTGTADETTGAMTYVVDADSASTSAGSDAVSVVKGNRDANGNIDYAVDLSATTKESLAKADTAIQSVTGDSNITATTDANNNVTVELADDITVKNVNTDSTTIGGTVVIDNSGINAGNTVITNVADGVDATDAVNKGQLDGVDTKVSTLDGRVTVNEGGIANNTTNITANKAEIDKGMNFGDGKTANNYKLGDTINVKTGDNLTSTTIKDGVRVALDRNIKVDSITTGDVSMSADGINAGAKRVTNVANGIDATDAINVAQLNDFGYRVNNKIDKVGDEANAGISSAMAMAALPQAYITGKSMLTGGMASYNGEAAVAVGLSKLSDNGRYVFKISGSADTEGNAGGAAGIGFHF